MKLKIILLGIIILVILGLVFFLNRPQNSLTNPSSNQEPKTEAVKPSDTFIEYTDPAGFSFNYPDNLSITKNEEADKSTYADLQLSSNKVSGSINLKITDSQFKTLDQWAKLNQGTSKAAKLGNLEALEIKTNDRLLLGSIDQGIFFTIEVPLIEEQFWMVVYNKLATDFKFVQPTPEAITGGTSEVVFEGEEVVE